MLAWRGRDREQVLARLRELRGGGTAGDPVLPDEAAGTPVPLWDCLAGFWRAGPELALVGLRPASSGAAGAVLRQLGKGLVDIRGRDLGDVLAPVYAEMAAAAEQRAVRS